MSKTILNSVADPVSNHEVSSKVSELIEASIFTPNPANKKLKAKFWSRYTPGPLNDITQLSLSEAVAITGDSRLNKLWAQPGFREWFTNTSENREKLEYLFTLALDTAEEILVSETTQASAKVNMIKVLAELANKFPNKYQQEKFVDDEINRMSELQLKAWLERRGVSTGQPKPIEALDASYTEGSSENEEVSDAKADKNSR